MAFYTIPFSDIASDAAADTWKTIAALEVGDSQENRFRLRELMIGPGDTTPLDENLQVKINRINDLSAGSVGTAGTTIAAANISPVDAKCAPVVDCEANINYSAEPTTYNTNALWQGAFNLRGALIKQWEPDAAPSAFRDQLLAVLVAPEDAITGGAKVCGCMLVESY